MSVSYRDPGLKKSRGINDTGKITNYLVFNNKEVFTTYLNVQRTP